MLKGFKDFLLKGNVLDLAVAVVVGAAFTAIVTAFTENIVNVYSPAADLARPIGRKPAAVIRVPVSMGQSTWSLRIRGSSTPRWRARARTVIQPEAAQVTGSAMRRDQGVAGLAGVGVGGGRAGGGQGEGAGGGTLLELVARSGDDGGHRLPERLHPVLAGPGPLEHEGDAAQGVDGFDLLRLGHAPETMRQA